MPSILFVCTANQFRSPIAAALLSRQLESDENAKGWRIESAGTWVKSGLSVPAFALEAARSIKLDGLDAHRTRQVGPKLLERFDLVLVMESGHKEALCAEFPSACDQVYLLSEVVDDLPYDIPDPAKRGGDPSAVASILADLISKGKDRILKLARVHQKRPS